MRVNTAHLFLRRARLLMLCTVFFAAFGPAQAVSVQPPKTQQELDKMLADMDPKIRVIALMVSLDTMKKKSIRKSNPIFVHAIRKLEETARITKDKETVMLAIAAITKHDERNAFASRKIDDLARSGHAEAQYFLGIINRDGALGRPKNVSKSHKWMLAAAKRGHARAAFEVGHNYYFGRYGVEKNLREGFKWWVKSAEGGHPPAQYNVATFYFDGKLVKKDITRFLYWMQKAAKGGDAKAKQVVEAARKSGLLK